MAGKTKNWATDWADGLSRRLAADVDKRADALLNSEVATDDLPASDRRIRFITNIARAAKAIVALASTPPEDETETSDDGGSESYDPEELARAGELFDARLDSLRATIEAKRLEGWTYTPRAVAGGQGHAAPS